MSELKNSIDSPATAAAAKLHQDCVFVKYKASRGRHTRLVKVVKTAEDPLQPPKFRYKRIPRAGRDSPPPVVMQSPPRQLTAEDLQNWKVPPCVSRWKNPKGYAIPLDKRHAAAEGWESEINHRRMAELAEALYVAEAAARDGVALRGKIRREWEMREKELRELAMRARDGNWLKKRKERRRRRRRGGVEAAVEKGKGRDWVRLQKGNCCLILVWWMLMLMEMKMKMRERQIEFEKDGDFFGLDEFFSKLNQ